MNKEHQYQICLNWTGNLGEGTKTYESYSRDHVISTNHKPQILGSADSVFRGDTFKYNPEELLLASVSSCHMLWYLHLCADENIVVVEYSDNPTGILVVNNDGGYFKEITLNPSIKIANKEHVGKAIELHIVANKKCFIANSCNFPIRHFPKILVI